MRNMSTNRVACIGVGLSTHVLVLEVTAYECEGHIKVHYTFGNGKSG